MAIFIGQRQGSGDFKMGPTGVEGKILFYVIGAADQDEAYDTAAADPNAPAYINGIPRGSINVEDQGGLLYFVDVDYSLSAKDAQSAGGDPGTQGSGTGGGNPAGGGDASAELGRRYTGTTKGGTKHITQSYGTLSKTAPAGKTAPDLKGLIGFNQGSVDGVDVKSPQPEFSIAVTLPIFTQGYFFRLCSMTGTTNENDWKGFKADELLFLGADFANRQGKQGGWDVTYSFAYSPVEYNVSVGDAITVPEKPGWFYLWVAYEDVKDANKLVKQPLAAYVERVYRRSDFNILQL